MFPEGVIGGAMWAVANMMIPSIVNLIGLGLGFVFWNSTNLLVGYCVVREGERLYLLLESRKLSSFVISTLLLAPPSALPRYPFILNLKPGY